MDIQTFWSGWEVAAGIAVLISFAITSLAYMLAQFFQMPALVAWAKNEFGQAIASAFAVGGVIGFVYFLSIVSTEMTGLPGCSDPWQACHIQAAKTYLNNTFWEVFEESRGIFRLNMWMGLISTFSFSIAFRESTLAVIWTVPFAGLSIPLETIDMAFNTLTKVMMSLKFQEILLEYIQKAIFPMLLVYGVLLRTFFFTRRLGGLLIAIALSLYTVYPLMYVLGQFVYVNTTLGSKYVVIEPSGFESLLEDPNNPGHYDVINLVHNQGKLKKNLGYYITGEFLIGNDGILERTGKLLVYSTFLPFIAIFTTIASVKALSLLLGGDVEIAGLTRLI